MEVELPQISLREIDSEHIDNVEDNPQAVQFSIRLSETPPATWVQEFEQLYKQTPYMLKPPVRLEGDRLHIIYLPRYVSELPAFLRFLALITRRANEETRRTEEMHTSDAQERRKREFRETLRHIELPS